MSKLRESRIVKRANKLKRRTVINNHERLLDGNSSMLWFKQFILDIWREQWNKLTQRMKVS